MINYEQVFAHVPSQLCIKFDKNLRNKNAFQHCVAPVLSSSNIKLQ